MVDRDVRHSAHIDPPSSKSQPDGTSFGPDAGSNIPFCRTVVADDPFCADENRPPAADRNTGDLPAERDDLVEVVIAMTMPDTAKRCVESEERLPVGPEPADVYPRGLVGQEGTVRPAQRPVVVPSARSVFAARAVGAP
jgi:hypothetical protein